MSTKLLTLILTGTFFAVTMIPADAMARQGGMMSGQTQQIRTQSSLQIKDQQRLQDGSCATCLKAAQTVPTINEQKKGNTYGPGDGTGNNNLGPQDGTGYGAPTNR
jgi:hypothetical protein